MDKLQIALVVSLLAGAAAADDVFPPTFELSSLLAANGGDGTLGFVLQGGIESGRVGDFTAPLGDVNNDGVDDVIVSAIFAEVDGKERVGVCYVLFGRADGFGPEILASELDGSNGFRIVGVDAFDATGLVSSAGDLNADGIPDILIGAPKFFNPDGLGAAYVIFGRAGGFPSQIDLASLSMPGGFRIGVEKGDSFGESVANAGDVNADGMSDIIIGEGSADPLGRDYAGKAYVVFGSLDTFPDFFDVASLDGTNGFTLLGANPEDFAGGRVAGVGDINGDGIDDFGVSARGSDLLSRDAAGACYVMFGRNAGFPAEIDLANIDGSEGLVIVGPQEGAWLSALNEYPGDFNADGINDLLLGAPFAGDANDAFAACVFGSDAGLPDLIDLAELDGSTGFFVRTSEWGVTWLGFRVSSAGDIDADGVDDIIVGAMQADGVGGFGTGRAYVIYGDRREWPSLIEVQELDGEIGFNLTGFRRGSLTAQSVNYAGDLNGDGIADMIIGSPQASPNDLDRAGEAFIVFGRDLSCAADLTGSSDPDDPEYGVPDGQVDSDDFFFYLDAFASGDTDICDIDEDADCDAKDFFAYLDLFAAGCS